MVIMKWMSLQLNPVPYHNIRKHESVELLYGKKLVEDGIISEDEMNDVIDSVQKKCVQRMIKLISLIRWIIQTWKT